MKTAIDVEQAFKFIKSLWPEVERIRPSKHTSVIKLYVMGSKFEECIRNLDLGVNVIWNNEEAYPVPEKQWRPAEFPRDWNKAAIFRSDGGRWYEGILVGYAASASDRHWLRIHLAVTDRWEECKVEVK